VDFVIDFDVEVSEVTVASIECSKGKTLGILLGKKSSVTSGCNIYFSHSKLHRIAKDGTDVATC